MTSRKEQLELAGRRKWKAAMDDANKATTSWPQAVAAARAMDDDQLHAAAQGCTELSCLYHGAVNQVRNERGIRYSA